MALTFGFWYKVGEFEAKLARSVPTEAFAIFWSFLVLLSVVVPMSLFIT